MSYFHLRKPLRFIERITSPLALLLIAEVAFSLGYLLTKP